MIAHQNKTMQAHAVTRHRLSQQLKEVLPVPVIADNGLAFIAAGGDVIPSARISLATASTLPVIAHGRQLLNVKM
jgi:hypothetical protein